MSLSGLGSSQSSDSGSSGGTAASRSTMSRSPSPVSHTIANHNQTILQATMQSLGPSSRITDTEDRDLSGISRVRRRKKGKKVKWKLVASCKTQHVYQWFESQRNDYSSQSMQITSWANVIWVGHPGNSPKDLSARAWFVQLDKGLAEHELRDVTSDKIKKVVLRAFFRCLGRCAIISKVPADSEGSDSEADTESESAQKKSKKGGRQKLPTRECEGEVRLMIEVVASDLGTANIYSCGNHKDANVEHLQYSRRLRLYMQGVGSRLGETASKLKRELRDGTSTDADTAALPRAYIFPDFRLPKGKEVDAVMKHIRTSKRLHSDPFAAVSIFVKRNPSRVFGEAQRCRSADAWPEHQTTFEAAVNKILKKAPQSTKSAVISYFNDNWWQSVWRDVTTDIGLQKGQTRDDANTNNTIERAFKTFDEIFLSYRVNKRIDRLVHVLAMDWFTYYESYASDVPRPSKELKEMMLHAHKMWESGTAIEKRDDGLFNVWDTVEIPQTQSQKKSKAHQNLKVVSFKVDLKHETLSCTCSKWKQTGKYCAHMHAVLLLERMGTAEESMKQEAGVFSEPLPWSSEQNYGKSASDSVYDAELHEALAQAEADVKNSPNNNNGEPKINN
ncbi:hypothetical protein CF319_g2518 [Tilletia indica]|nr:hypothetical protein CF319_g2518 [Tilletia indica]